jgi:hydroxyacylglutathione hydrolase
MRWVGASTVVLRQHIELNHEAPFLYLLFGTERALLLDTGATADPARFGLREAVDELVRDWSATHPAADYALVVAHSHAHGDHVAADEQFAARPRTTIVGHDPEAVAAFFGVDSWPTASGSIELGGRRLTVLPIPGHHPASIALFDPTTSLLLTGDTVYPGRLYVDDFPAFLASLDRLCAFADAHPVGEILGAHIEMSTTPFRDFPRGSTRHPDECELPMTVEQLHGIRDAARSVEDSPGAHRFADFAIWNGPSRGALVRQFVRRVLGR